MRVYIRLYREMGREDELDGLVERFYHDHIYETSVRRVCVEYYKEMKCWDKLKRLQGYDHRKDRLS